MDLPVLLLALVGSQPQAGVAPFTGIWLMDLGSSSGSPDRTHLVYRNGAFSRGEDKPDFTVRVDAFHSLPDDDFVDAVAVTALSPRRLRELDRFRGKLAYSVVYTVSADGSTMTQQVTDFSKPNHRPIPFEATYHRIGRPERDGSLITGRWQQIDVKMTQDNLSETLELDGGRFSLSGPGGYGYDAAIGGPPVPIRGDADTARIAVTMPNDRTIVEHMSLRGAPTVDMTMTLLADDRTISVTGKRHSDGSAFGWSMHKR